MVDPKSWQLAVAFLDDFDGVNADLTEELAQRIEDAIEDWLSDAERRRVIRRISRTTRHTA
jgi:hypothetical protein